MFSPKTMLPILFAINQPIQHHLSHLLTFPDIPYETGIYRIHSPIRILRGMGGGLSLIPNSTSAPVRTSATSVLIAFDVKTMSGNRWNARMISNERNACEVFLMDSETLQRKAILKMRVMAHDVNRGHSISASLTLFDFSTLVYSSVWLMVFYCSVFNQISHHRAMAVTTRCFELHLHRMYRLMITHGVDIRHKT